MGGDLDAVWRSVRDVLGTAAKDYSAAVAAGPTQAARGVTEAVARTVEGDAAMYRLRRPYSPTFPAGSPPPQRLPPTYAVAI
ncbi:hypothetical protein ACFQZZ_14845 [Nocardia sp. GCM10030253]|uniref:hypothetical protein n=1 Tax=Nocardia sp. GCM10030253 TaxID=3273404 RepID=UPI00362C6C24